MNKTFIIGEMGSTHDADFSRALRLVDIALEAGCDAVKGQYWSNATRLAERRNARKYLEVYQKYQMPQEWLGKLEAYCLGHGIEFMCSCYLPEDLDVVAPHVKRFKIASFEAADREFVKAHVVYNREIILSVGMQGAYCLPVGVDLTRFKLLHCVSAYPAPLSELNLRVLGSYLCGFSDHTATPFTGAIAVAAGAEILEVHFRLSDTDPANPDYHHSLTPDGLKTYVELARTAEKMMGDGLKRPQPSETPMMKYRVTA